MEISLIGKVGDTYLAVCECDGDEHYLTITKSGLRCPECYGEQRHYN